MYDTQSDYLQRYHDNDRSYRVLPRDACCGNDTQSNKVQKTSEAK